MTVKYSRDDLVTPDGLLAALQNLFPDFGDEGLFADIRSGDASLHGVMLEFSSSFNANAADPSQLAGLATLLNQCVGVPDSLENAVGTCFLEHLHQIDKHRVLWKRLPPDVKAHLRAH